MIDDEAEEDEDLSNQIYDCLTNSGNVTIDTLVEGLREATDVLGGMKGTEEFVMIDVLEWKQRFLSFEMSEFYELRKAKVPFVKKDSLLFWVEKYLSVLNGLLYSKKDTVSYLSTNQDALEALFQIPATNIPIEMIETLLFVLHNLCVAPSKDL